MRCFALLASFLIALVGGAAAEEPEARLALVVGNAAYSSVTELDNPANDAVLIAGSLIASGFDVTLLVDATQDEFKRAVAEFGRSLRASGPETVGLFYYAGHGIQSFGANYLLPVDAELSDAADLDLVALEAASVLRQMASARNRTNIMILDACRDNPFENVRDLNDNGLAEMNAPPGTFLSYATGPGAVALDGIGENSPFSAALAEAMTIEGKAIEQVFKAVRVQVIDETQGRQTPWDTSSLTRDFVFRAAAKVSPEEQAERRLWDAVKTSKDSVQILLFLRTHPDTQFREEAEALLRALVVDELGGAKTVTAATPEPEPEPEQPATRTGGPGEDEVALFERARTSGDLADYEAYLEAFPSGIFAELAKIESAGLAPSKTAEPVAEVTEPATSGGLRFDEPIQQGTAAILGLTIAEAAEGTPLFPPLEGLPEALWKGQACSACHQWTRETLCTQGTTYLDEVAARSLEKEHPYGGTYKRNLRRWAEGGCQ